jgi:hypothetical protein
LITNARSTQRGRASDRDDPAFLAQELGTPLAYHPEFLDRSRTLSIRLDDTELAQVHALAKRRDLPVSFLFRQWLADHWRAAFGDAAPPATRTKFGDAVVPTKAPKKSRSA